MQCKRKACQIIIQFMEYKFFGLRIINPQNLENILEILDQNRINIEVTPLYFKTNQLKTQQEYTRKFGYETN